MLKNLIQFLLQQSFEIWIWWQAVNLLLGSPVSEFSGIQLAWYYAITVVLTILALAIVYVPKKRAQARKTLYTDLKDDGSERELVARRRIVNQEWILPSGLFAMLVFYVFIERGFAYEFLTNTIFPVVPIWLIGTMLVYKILVLYLLLKTSNDHSEADVMSYQLFGYAFVFFVIGWCYIFFIFTYASPEHFLVILMPFLLVAHLGAERMYRYKKSLESQK